jgi:hypothetical protein
MAVRYSTKLKNQMHEAVRTALAAGAIYIYSGAQPANANAAPQGTLLGIVTVGAGAWTAVNSTANGLDFDAAVAGVLSKAVAETWQFAGLAVGTAGWFRFVMGSAADNLAADPTALYSRIDGRISTTGAEMNLSNLNIVVGAISTVDSFSISWPAGF